MEEKSRESFEEIRPPVQFQVDIDGYLGKLSSNALYEERRKRIDERFSFQVGVPKMFPMMKLLTRDRGDA